MEYIDDIQWIDERGFAIARKYQCNGSKGELCLVRLIIDNNEIVHSNWFMDSKFEKKLIERYYKEVNNPKNEVIMDIMETLKGLTIRQLKNLKPSYYNLAIDRKIAELEAKKEKVEKNAVTKVKRSTKKTTKTGSRKRNLQKKSV